MAILDAAERVLQTEGHAALSSRRIAEEAGLKQPLVYYYFHTMDDLLLATFKRRTERAIEALREALESEQPLRAVWRMNSEFQVSRLTAEFMAISNHHEGIRSLVRSYLEESRTLEAEAFARSVPGLADGGLPIGAKGIGLVIGSLSQTLMREQEIGVTTGHDEVRTFLDWCAERLIAPAR
jgi:AcrR family transcriptional regulator